MTHCFISATVSPSCWCFVMWVNSERRCLHLRCLQTKHLKVSPLGLGAMELYSASDIWLGYAGCSLVISAYSWSSMRILVYVFTSRISAFGCVFFACRCTADLTVNFAPQIGHAHLPLPLRARTPMVWDLILPPKFWKRGRWSSVCAPALALMPASVVTFVPCALHFKGVLFPESVQRLSESRGAVFQQSHKVIEGRSFPTPKHHEEFCSACMPPCRCLPCALQLSVLCSIPK